MVMTNFEVVHVVVVLQKYTLYYFYIRTCPIKVIAILMLSQGSLHAINNSIAT